MTNNLNLSALIVRKYNLGDKIYFKNIFTHIDEHEIDNAWNFASQKIQNREIIKDATNIETGEKLLAERLFDSYDKNITKIYSHLLHELNAKELKLKDENVERHFRHLLAIKYIELQVVETKAKKSKVHRPLKKRISNFIVKNFVIICIVGAVGYFIIPRTIDRMLRR